MDDNKMMDDNKKDIKDPLFNEAQAFLERYDKRILIYDELMFEDEIIKAYTILFNCYCEIRPRMNDKQRTKLDKYKNTRSSYYKYHNKNIPSNVWTNLQNNNGNFFNDLTQVAHELGLTMPDKPDDSGAKGV